MSAKKIGLSAFSCLLILLSFSATGLGYTETKVFVPRNAPGGSNLFYDSDRWTKEVGYAPVSAGANQNAGYVGAYSSAYLGGGDSEIERLRCGYLGVAGEVKVKVLKVV